MTTMSPERRAIDVNSFSPDDLAGLNDVEFRAVVDADLRRKAPKSGVWLRADLIAALRTPRLAGRWHAMLTRMQKSVDGQLSAREHDYQHQRAELDAQILKFTDRVTRGEVCHDPGTGVTLSAADAQSALTSLRLRRFSLRAAHMKARAGTVRFQTGLNEATLEARFLRDQTAMGAFQSVVALERDHWASRCRALVAAIEHHRDAVTEDLDGELPDEIDTNLWTALRPTTESPVWEGSHEGNEGRDN